jgi:hypothetical protein
MSAGGGCLCGAVRYRVTGEPQGTSLCHCFSCRRSTGAPSLAWAIFPEEAVEIIAGDLVEHESSPGVFRGFCARCGSSLTYRRDSRPGLFDVTTASLDDPEAFPPAKEIWVEEKLSWMAAHPDRPHFAQFSTPAGPSS